jgi:hypothetical protein
MKDKHFDGDATQIAWANDLLEDVYCIIRDKDKLLLTLC